MRFTFQQWGTKPTNPPSTHQGTMTVFLEDGDAQRWGDSYDRGSRERHLREFDRFESATTLGAEDFLKWVMVGLPQETRVRLLQESLAEAMEGGEG